MRVRVAYISSLGTTAILLAAALTLLTVVGTIVAFKGWPGSANGSGVQSVPIVPGSAPTRAALVRRAPAAHHLVRKAPSHAAARPGSTAGLVKSAGTGKRIVPGLIMVPVHAAPPMAAHPISATQTPQYPEPVAGPTTQRDVPPTDQGPGPVPSAGGGVALPSLDQAVPPPPDPATALSDGLLSGGPPPPLLLGGLHLR
jgi:hypothetical protein